MNSELAADTLRVVRLSHDLLIGVMAIILGFVLMGPGSDSVYLNAQRELQALTTLRQQLQACRTHAVNEILQNQDIKRICDFIRRRFEEAGLDVSELKESGESFPYYFYDEDLLEGTIAEIRRRLQNVKEASMEIFLPDEEWLEAQIGDFVRGAGPGFKVRSWQFARPHSVRYEDDAVTPSDAEQLTLLVNEPRTREKVNFGTACPAPTEHSIPITWAKKKGLFTGLENDSGNWLQGLRTVWEDVENKVLESATRFVEERIYEKRNKLSIAGATLDARAVTFFLPMLMGLTLTFIAIHLSNLKRALDSCLQVAWLPCQPGTVNALYAIVTLLVGPVVIVGLADVRFDSTNVTFWTSQLVVWIAGLAALTCVFTLRRKLARPKPPSPWIVAMGVRS